MDGAQEAQPTYVTDGIQARTEADAMSDVTGVLAAALRTRSRSLNEAVAGVEGTGSLHSPRSFERRRASEKAGGGEVSVVDESGDVRWRSGVPQGFFLLVGRMIILHIIVCEAVPLFFNLTRLVFNNQLYEIWQLKYNYNNY